MGEGTGRDRRKAGREIRKKEGKVKDRGEGEIEEKEREK